MKPKYPVVSFNPLIRCTARKPRGEKDYDPGFGRGDKLPHASTFTLNRQPLVCLQLRTLRERTLGLLPRAPLLLLNLHAREGLLDRADVPGSGLSGGRLRPDR
jgi:hypothetical protein